MNVLVIAAHFDDAEIGCGGTISKWSRNGHKMHILVLTDSGYSNEAGDEIRDSSKAEEEGGISAKILGASLIFPNKKIPVFALYNNDDVRCEILRAIKENNIDTILCHWSGDSHCDHSELSKAALMASRHLPRFLGYRSNFYDGTKIFVPSVYVDISDTIELKIKSIKTYHSEFVRAGGTWIETLDHQHRIDGLKVGVKYAESFESVRFLL